MQLYRLLVLLSSFSFFIVADFASATSINFDRNYWLKILHFKNHKSKADGQKFFLAPDGKTNPDSELAATIKAFGEEHARVGWFNYHPQCVFRERFQFLKSQGLLDGIPEVSCPEFDEWKKGLNAESVSLIFSSSYPNNPSSLFGHTLLRLNQKSVGEKKQDLLDYAVAFSAIPEKEDLGLVFAVKGMFGGYKGLFEITKYYTKVNEYNNGESRDLIEYNLAMEPAELDRMINHLWELYQTTYFDYYFTDENCSAVLADLLAVAYKDDDRVNAHGRWYYLPGEMVKHFSQLNGRIKSVTYRASLKKQVAREWENLSKTEKEDVKEILESKKLPENSTNAKVLDAVTSNLDFTHYRTKKKLDDENAKLMRTALLKRAKLPKSEANELNEAYDESNRPENAHDPQKFSMFSRLEKSSLQTGFEIKQGYHDLMSRDLGYDSFSQFDFLSAAFLYDFKRKKVAIDELMFVNLASLHEYKYYDPQLSWRAKVNYERVYDLDCDACRKVNLSALGGITLKPQKTSVFNLMLGIFGESSKKFTKGFRLGPQSEISYFQLFSDKFKLGFIEEIKFDSAKKISEDYYHQTSLRTSYFLTTNSDLRIDLKKVSQFGSFKYDTTLFEIKYGLFY